jgi:hypothetical protein
MPIHKSCFVIFRCDIKFIEGCSLESVQLHVVSLFVLAVQVVADFDILLSEVCFILSDCDRSFDEVAFPSSQGSVHVENGLLPVSVWVVWTGT